MGYFLLGLVLVWVTLAWAEAGFRPAPTVRKWLKEPGNLVRLATWVIAVAVVALTLVSSTDTLLGSLRSEAIGTAFAVIVINELGIYRAALQEKRSIIEQMGSQVNDAALEAVRLARKKEWLYDGSLKGANLGGANLAGAYLAGANLADAILIDANLAGANLWLANLAGARLPSANLADAILWRATYDTHTKWPDGFDPIEAGAWLNGDLPEAVRRSMLQHKTPTNRKQSGQG